MNEPIRRRDFSDEWRSLHDSLSKERKPASVVLKKAEQEVVKKKFIIKIVEK